MSYWFIHYIKCTILMQDASNRGKWVLSLWIPCTIFSVFKWNSSNEKTRWMCKYSYSRMILVKCCNLQIVHIGAVSHYFYSTVHWAAQYTNRCCILCCLGESNSSIKLCDQSCWKQLCKFLLESEFIWVWIIFHTVFFKPNAIDVIVLWQLLC